MKSPFVKAVLRATRLVLLVVTWALTAPAPAQSPERLMVAPGPPDIRTVAVDLAYYERGRQGWMESGSPKIGGMVAVRCSYVYTAGAEAPLWLVAFQEGGNLRERMVGPGLLDPKTRQTSRTWYAKIIAPGASQIACVADADNQVAESDESNNRMARTLDVPSAARTTSSQPDSRAASGSRLAIVTARDAALARGSDPAFDLRFVEAAGIKRAGDPRALRAIPSIATAVVGEPIAVNCGYRVHMDAANGETLRIAPWRISIERDGQAMHDSSGKTDLVSIRGATNATDVIARWTPTQAGAYRFRCQLDAAGAIAETDESNNVVDFPLQVGTATARAAPPAKPKPTPRGQPQLRFVAYQAGSLALVMGPTESTVYKSNLKPQLKWQSPDAAAYDWRWQVSLWPFPGDPSVPPPALLREGPVTKNTESVFSIDLGSFPPLGQAAKTGKTGPPGAATGAATGAKPPTAAKPPAVGTKTPGAELVPPASGTQAKLTKTAPPQGSAGIPGVADAPIDFHIRILPLKGSKPAGAPSNAVVAHYRPGANPYDAQASEAITTESTKKQKLAEMNEQATVHKIDILSFERPVFADPGRYGCIIVLANPYYQKTLGHPLFLFKPGEDEEYCPKKNPDTQQKSDWEQFLEGVEGYAHAWNGLSWFYDKAKDYAATLFAEVIVPCGLLKELGDDAASTCQEIAKEVAGTAISVGLTAAGVPPSIPDLEGMSDLAKGKAAKAAAGYTCDLIESEGGECTPEMRKGLEAAYGKGIDQLQKDLIKQSNEPDCGNLEEAKAHGLQPLPCFSNFPGTKVKPAPGSVETSPAVKVRITRIKPDPKFATDCSVHASLVVENDIPGYGKTEATPWPAAKAQIPPIPGVGGSSVITLNFGPRQPWHPSGKQGATAEWYQLLMGGTGTLNVVGSGTAAAQAPLPPGNMSVACATGPGPKTLSIPKDFTQQPWKIVN